MAMPEWTRSDWFKNTVTVIVTALIAFEMARLEVVRRAHREFKEGEKYYAWYQDPAKKSRDLLELKTKGKMSDNEYEHLMEEDMYKEAVVWWQTVGDFYYLPHSKWVDQAEERIWSTGRALEEQGWKKGLKIGRDDLEHALMSYKAIQDSWKPLHGRDPGIHLDEAARKVTELEAKGLQWP